MNWDIHVDYYLGKAGLHGYIIAGKSWVVGRASSYERARYPREVHTLDMSSMIHDPSGAWSCKILMVTKTEHARYGNGRRAYT